MTIEAIKDRIPDFAKDTRLNLSSMLSDETLAADTKYGLMLAVAVATRNAALIGACEREAARHGSPVVVQAAKAAAAVMAMNNVYYRFVHLAANPEYKTMPARLRMNILANPGVDKKDFELWSLAVSAVNGCGACIDAHEKTLKDHGASAAEIQTAVRFAAILQSAAVALDAADAVAFAAAAE